MERRRIPYERERWLSAVLIVTAIAGASVVVPRWPLSVTPVPRAVPPLSARSLPLIELPGVLIPAAQSQHRPSSREAPGPQPGAEAPAVVLIAAAEVPGSELPAPPAATAASEEVAPETSVLVGRRVGLAYAFHPLTEDEPFASSSPSSYALVEIPAVAVTRAVMVAGRGIRTGLRATSAMFRAAF